MFVKYINLLQITGIFRTFNIETKMLRKQDSNMSSLYSTVKKTKQVNQLHHAKSYDDILTVQQLEPSQIKVLLNNDLSLKIIHRINQVQKPQNNPHFSSNLKAETKDRQYASNTGRQARTPLYQILQQSIKKQNILIKKNLFDPYKYFGSSSQVLNIQQSSRHHQSRLQAMFSESPLATDHSASYRKISPKNNKRKIDVDVHRISNSELLAKLERLQVHEKNMKQKLASKTIQQQLKNSNKNFSDKQNILENSINSTTNHLINRAINQNHVHLTNSTIQQPLNSFNKNIATKALSILHSNNSTQQHQQSLISSNKKTSIQNYSKSYRTKPINCSPKSYVKQMKQNYLKMNLNNLQKVRLKLKLTSAKA